MSLLHADVSESGVNADDLDKLACRVEDVLFELKEEIFRVKGTKEQLPSRDSCSLSSSPGGSTNVLVDNVVEINIMMKKVRSRIILSLHGY